MTDAVFDIQNLTVVLGGRRILSALDFTLHAGESLVIVGPNGAGKSTLLKAMLRLVPVQSGQIYFKGRSLKDWPRRELAQHAAYVPQAGERAIPYSVYEFILMARYPYLSTFAALSEKDHAIAAEAMAQAEVEKFAHRPLYNLSGGERQKVFIAAALAQSPDILFLDEATAFLDYRHQTEVLSLITRLQRDQGVSVVSVTHDLNQGTLAYDRALALKDGQKVFFGSPAELFRSDILENIYDTAFHFLEDPESGRSIVVPGKAML